MLWDQQGLVYYESLQPNETETAERYLEQMIILSRTLHHKRPEWAEGQTNVISLNDNARLHAARIVKETLELLDWEVLSHPPYSLSIAPSNYHLFRSVENGLQ